MLGRYAVRIIVLLTPYFSVFREDCHDSVFASPILIRIYLTQITNFPTHATHFTRNI